MVGLLTIVVTRPCAREREIKKREAKGVVAVVMTGTTSSLSHLLLGFAKMGQAHIRTGRKGRASVDNSFQAKMGQAQLNEAIENFVLELRGPSKIFVNPITMGS